jgi:predicted Zn-dependent peptidase
VVATLKADRQTLPNGLRVVAAAVPAHRVVLSAHVGVGPRYESAADNGISHFLEHMLYRGTPRHPSAHEQALAFEALGGTLVATTGVETGTLAIAIPPESFSPVIELFADVFRRPIFSGLEIEKGIVREEILESLDDDGREIDADRLMRRLVFGAHPLGFSITGTIQRLEQFDANELARHHRAHYVAQNSVIALAGPIDPERAIRQVADQLGDLERGSAPTSTPPPPADGPHFSYLRHAASSQTSIRLGFRAAGDHDPLEAATDLLLRVLDDGMSTRLYHRICDARGLCYDVSAGYESFADSGLVDLAADAAHERAGDVLQELLDLLRELRDDGPRDDELAKAKARHRWQLEALLDDPGDLADFHGAGQLAGTALSLDERRERIDAVTKDQVRTAAQAVLRRETLAVVAVGLLAKRGQAALARMIDGF